MTRSVDLNAQANARWYYWNALMTAAYYGNIRIIRLLLEFNANLDLEDVNGKKAIRLAEEMKHFDCVELLQKELGDYRTLNISNSNQL